MNTVTFDSFSELVERNCFNSWRASIGRENRQLIDNINSIMLTRSDKGAQWEFSFCVRVGKRWFQSTKAIDAFEYDPMDLEDDGLSPNNKAMGIACDIMDSLRDNVLGA